MSVLDAVAAGRRAAEALFFDSCTITAVATRPVFNPETGETTVTPAAEVYAGRCKVQARATAATTPQVGGQLMDVVTLEVHVPIGVVGLETDQQILITSAELDPELVGRRFRVTTVPAKSFATARRLRCEETRT